MLLILHFHEQILRSSAATALICDSLYDSGQLAIPTSIICSDSISTNKESLLDMMITIFSLKSLHNTTQVNISQKCSLSGMIIQKIFLSNQAELHN